MDNHLEVLKLELLEATWQVEHVFQIVQVDVQTQRP